MTRAHRAQEEELRRKGPGDKVEEEHAILGKGVSALGDGKVGCNQVKASTMPNKSETGSVKGTHRHTRTYTCSIHTHTLYNAFDSFECEKGPEKTGSPYASLFLHLLLLLCFVDVSLNFSSELKFINCAASTHAHTHVYTRISGIPWLQVYVQLPGKKKNLNLK